MSEKPRYSIKNVNGIEELQDLIRDQSIDKSDVCLSGSTCLAVRGIRENGDLDYVVPTNLRNYVDSSRNRILSSRRPYKYLRLNINDDEIVRNPKYHDIVDGYKVIRPELYYSMKKIRMNSRSKRRHKDYEDIKLLEEYKKKSNDWNPELVIENPRSFVTTSFFWGIETIKDKGIKHLFMKGIPDYLRNFVNVGVGSDYYGEPTNLIGKAKRSYRVDGASKTLARGWNLIKLREPTGILDQYSNFTHKTKVGTLADRKLVLSHPTGEFITEQYSNKQFVRMDIIVRLLAIEALANNERVPDLVHKFEEIAETEVLEPIKQRAVYERESTVEKVPNLESVSIGYDSSILTPNRLAEFLWHDPTSFRVTIKPHSSGDTYPIDWFEGNGFEKNDIGMIKQRFEKLLYDSGSLFVFVLWPPAHQHFEQIVELIDDLSNVIFYQQLSFSEEDFPELVKDLYGMQTLKPKYKEAKIDALKGYDKKIIVGGVELHSHRIREGKSHEMNEIKEHVREKFTPEIIPDNPSANIIMHSTDNFVHNRTTLNVIEKYCSENIF